ncbi:helix-turn-helix transcriptional regulator [Acidomonas methanolica]|uniref:HTH cro/C1-type domain-containing protein n=1 Tax=Acidomonas methanolica NBRC 104435 TaxID=1231351 RepID=A0A023D8W1_ACIMT|nr:helix-turn-helix transcriptional regulator [Acidomonas methanolica]MBU2653457.1 helix-turn-helix domain-containing protein [Acidomonas methanolica]TCS32410.1 helix-turn-helix protein [Acidomonas methanolica]GAJ30216.1 hypothetical protein Amme_112_004 [Acidomonas methanolica NBRC 104435]GBQ52851.1 hypothetical protein AA0498_1816 [Acidomonas methanolica]GEK97846.1 hypothetical protein AME01nite_03450 [Acidomonas methanolica NBRC 104435]
MTEVMQDEHRNRATALMVGEFIREIRGKRGLTQGQLGSLVGKDAPLIGDWERGKCGMRLTSFLDLIWALDLSADELIGFLQADGALRAVTP